MFEIKLGVIQSKKINNNIKIVFLFWNFSSPHRRDRHDSSGSKRSGPSRFEGGGSGARGELFVTFSKLEIKYWMHLKTFYLSSLKYRAAYISLMYGFCKKSLRKDEPLTSSTLFFLSIFVISFGWVCCCPQWVWCCTHPKVMTNMLKKVFNWSEVHLFEVTFYNIHTLIG